MRAINTGNKYVIYDNSIKTYDRLPAQSYQVCFNKQEGFFLDKYADIEINEKIYGIHQKKVEKVLHSFEKFNRNLGVILSGDKGIGKSLFSKLLSKQAIDSGYPLIIVNTYYPGIADYLNEIDQEVIVLFDEFDKTFADRGEPSPQAEMLTLFDGISMGKKLFIVTCNSLSTLNSYLINRPGRFHYHFRFDYPSEEAITEYLMDKLPESAQEEIKKVVEFSYRVKLNYDCLRAIAFELSNGEKFEDAIKDLNIIDVGQEQSCNITLYFKDGTSCYVSQEKINLFDSIENSADLYTKIDGKTKYIGVVCFTPRDSNFIPQKGGCVISGEDVTFTPDAFRYESKEYNIFKNKEIDYLFIRPNKKDTLHFNLNY
jgi:hypothetical protein